MSDEVIGQPLHELTVAIRRDLNDTHIYGTGFVVAREPGLIVTCRHVVETICGGRPAIGSKVGVYFREVADETRKRQWASVVACLEDYDDDVVLLKLENSPAPIEYQPFGLGQASRSLNKAFYSYGFGRTDKDPYIALPLSGNISGPVDVDATVKLRVRQIAIEPKSRILHGHSGSPILDTELNRIVGIIIRYSEDARLGIITDCRILTIDAFAQFGLPFSDVPIAKDVAPRPSDGIIDVAKDLVDPSIRNDFYGVPDIVPETEWVGRDNLLQILSDDWANPAKRVSALIGFGGEGKSSLVRRWLNTVEPDGIFWWSFYKRSDVDEFFETAFRYLSGGKHKTKENRAEKLGAYLYVGKYLFILDGFEVVQRSDFDRYGDITNSELQKFLEYFLSPAHESRCIITSRLPLRFGHYMTFAQHDVERLSPDEGCTLLQKLGVNDSRENIRTVVQTWEGHALTLTLIGTYLSTRHEGKIAELATHVEDLPTFTADERRSEQVSRVLRRYDSSLLDEKAQAFLLIFSAFRLSVPASAFAQVFRNSKIPGLDLSSDVVDDTAFKWVVEQLKSYRIIRHDENGNDYTIHPLMRNHYDKRLKNEYADSVGRVHNLIKDYYHSLVPQAFSVITLIDLAPLTEAIYHACCAGMYDEAFDLYTKSLAVTGSRGSTERATVERPFSDILVNWLGAHDTANELLLGFFAHRDISNDPQVSEENKPTILKDVARCHMYLSRLEKAAPLYLRAIDGYVELANWGQASSVYRDLTILHMYSGNLSEAIAAAEDALSFVVRPDTPQELEAGAFQENTTDAVVAWALIGFIESLQGEAEQAALSFAQARLLHRRKKEGKTLPMKPGLFYVMYLYQAGETKAATHLTKTYLKQCYQHEFTAEKNQCHRVLGDIFAATGGQQRAERHYTLAVKFAREFARRDLLIEALAARGRWAACQGNADLARADLEEALGYAKDGYRLYEVDVRVGFAILYQMSGKHEAAMQEAETAERMSSTIGYERGRRDTTEVLNSLRL